MGVRSSGPSRRKQGLSGQAGLPPLDKKFCSGKRNETAGKLHYQLREWRGAMLIAGGLALLVLICLLLSMLDTPPAVGR
jgi:predicted nucleic acid-binding Zn ribbon protein